MSAFSKRSPENPYGAGTPEAHLYEELMYLERKMLQYVEEDAAAGQRRLELAGALEAIRVSALSYRAALEKLTGAVV